MRVRTSELIKALDYIKKHGDTQDLDVTVDPNLKSSVVIKADCLGDDVTILIYEADLNIFPKITKTERL